MFEGHMLAAVRARIEQDNANAVLLSLAGKEVGERLIRIIESQYVEKRLAFTKETIEALKAGCDYSHCETIDDMSEVYTRYPIELAFNKEIEKIERREDAIGRHHYGKWYKGICPSCKKQVYINDDDVHWLPAGRCCRCCPNCGEFVLVSFYEDHEMYLKLFTAYTKI